MLKVQVTSNGDAEEVYISIFKNALSVLCLHIVKILAQRYKK